MARTPKKSRFQQTGGMPSGYPIPARVVAGYLRVSTDEQAKSGLGLGDQRHRITGMAVAKGWPEPIWYADEGISGTKDWTKRPGLARLREDIKTGHVNAVITLDISRIGRRALDVVRFAEDMGRHGAEFVSCKEAFDTSTPQGQFVLFMFAALAQLERDTIAERVRGALAEHSRRDGEAGGGMPYGYVRDAGHLRVDAPQARIIRRIFAMRAVGATMRAIAKELNRRRYPSPHKKSWHHSSVQVVLANERYYRGGLRGASQIRWPVILKESADTNSV